MTNLKTKLKLIQERLQANFQDLTDILSGHIQSSNYVKLAGDTHAINMHSETVDKLFKIEQALISDLVEYDKLFAELEKIKLTYIVSEKEQKCIKGLKRFLSSLDLKSNLHPGKINKDGEIHLEGE